MISTEWIRLDYTTEMDIEDSLFDDGNEDSREMDRLHDIIVKEAIALGFTGKVETKLVKEGTYLPETISFIYLDKSDPKPYERVSHCHALIEVLESIINK